MEYYHDIQTGYHVCMHTHGKMPVSGHLWLETDFSSSKRRKVNRLSISPTSTTKSFSFLNEAIWHIRFLWTEIAKQLFLPPMKIVSHGAKPVNLYNSKVAYIYSLLSAITKLNLVEKPTNRAYTFQPQLVMCIGRCNPHTAQELPTSFHCVDVMHVPWTHIGSIVLWYWGIDYDRALIHWLLQYWYYSIFWYRRFKNWPSLVDYYLFGHFKREQIKTPASIH